MSTALTVVLFALATAAALAASHVLIIRLERIGARLALTGPRSVWWRRWPPTCQMLGRRRSAAGRATSASACLQRRGSRYSSAGHRRRAHRRRPSRDHGRRRDPWRC
jgi:hypothetical protein